MGGVAGWPCREWVGYGGDRVLAGGKVGKRLPSESTAAAAFQYVTDARASRHDRDARDSAAAVAAAAAAEAEAAGTYRRDGQCEWRFSVKVVVLVSFSYLHYNICI